MASRLDKKILLRLTQEERAGIQAQARTRGMSVNDYIRAAVLGLPTEERLSLTDRLEALERRLDAAGL